MTADQSGPVPRASAGSTDSEKLAQIAALCHDADREKRQHLAVHPEDAGVYHACADVDDLNAILAEPGPAAPPHTIDRHMLLAVLHGWTPPAMHPFNGALADAISALVRPVEGVTLTPEEAARVRGWYRRSSWALGSDDRALASRLEALS